MRRQAALLTLIFGLGFGSLMAVPLSPVSEQSKINQLIDQLGSANFRQREAASRELEAMGESALDPLRRATKHVDMEIAQRALSLVTTIEKKAENAKILAPTYVELTFKNTNVEEAVAVLSRKSGYQIVLGGDKTKLADRKVTFETGKVPFWMALDMLCEKANLVEGDASAVVNPGIDVPQPIGPIRVRPLPVQIQPIQIQPLQLKPIQIQPVPVPVQIEKPIQLQPVPAPVQIEKDAPAKPVPAPARPINNNRNIEKAPAPEGFAAEAPAKDEAPAKENAKPNFQPAQPIVQPLPVPPMMGRILPGRPVINGNGAVIVLVDGKSNPSPMHVAGAIRIREIKNAAILANFGQVPENEIGLLFEVKSEPKLQILHILGVKIDSAIDNYEQLLSQSLALNDGNTMNEFQVQEFAKRQAQLQIAQPAIARVQVANSSGSSFVSARLKKGDKDSKSIKELRGTATVQVRTPVEEIVAVENILKAKADAVTGKSNSSLKVVNVVTEANGDVKFDVELQHSNEIQPHRNGQAVNQPLQGGNLRLQFQAQGQAQAQIAAAPAMMANYLGLELVDAKGESIPLVMSRTTKNMFQQGGRTIFATLTFRPKKDQEAAKLAFKGTRVATIDVPFVLKDVATR